MYLSKVHKFHKESCCLEQVYHFKYYFFRLSSIERIKIQVIGMLEIQNLAERMNLLNQTG